MMRACLLVLGLLAASACKPGRCLRHSDCPAEASCNSGVCRLPPKQSTSLSQPGQEENQSVAPSEGVDQNGDDGDLVADGGALGTSSGVTSVTSAAQSTTAESTLTDDSSDDSASSSSAVNVDGSVPRDAGIADAAVLPEAAALPDAANADADAAQDSAL